MTNGILSVPAARNEPVLAHAPGSPERRALRAQLKKMAGEVVEIRPCIAGRRVATGRTAEVVMPHEHRHVLAVCHQAGPAEVTGAIEAAHAAHRTWSRTPWEQRAAVFLRAAELLAGPWRTVLNAATMLGQSKTAHQAEIDSACELIDFWRFNVAYAEEIYRQQPNSAPGTWNYLDYRPLEGFVLAVTPFNFTAIAGNLPTAPAIMGNTVIWKPASSAVYAAHFLMADRLRYAAGNFYVNDKPTGAVVGQQPFGGARASGTNDKAGSALNLLRWTSPRAIKETFVPPTDFRYQFMEPGD